MNLAFGLPFCFFLFCEQSWHDFLGCAGCRKTFGLARPTAIGRLGLPGFGLKPPDFVTQVFGVDSRGFLLSVTEVLVAEVCLKKEKECTGNQVL
jgi:hypothetical protein